MKLLVCTNFANPFHTGGAERVVRQITEYLSNECGWDCYVLCKHGSRRTTLNGVNIIPLKESDSESVFLEEVKNINPDHLFVYSDWFFRWESILVNAEKINCKKSIAMVGMNRMRSSIPQNKKVADLFLEKSNLFKVLTHDKSYFDSKQCIEWGIPISVVHNAIDLKEFDDYDKQFYLDHGVKTEKTALCVANFFPGKGQEFLLPIMRKHKDMTWVFVFSTLFFSLGNNMQRSFENQCANMGIKTLFLKDVSRKEVISAYHCSDFHVFPSQSECGPIAILESMAARKPWVALNVGHVPSLKGGICVYSSYQKNSLLKFDSDISREFESSILKISKNKDFSNILGEEGRKQIEEEYNWAKVKLQYKEFFENA
jgi:glycosyltransferase involved in cell wall biosynthesis